MILECDGMVALGSLDAEQSMVDRNNVEPLVRLSRGLPPRGGVLAKH